LIFSISLIFYNCTLIVEKGISYQHFFDAFFINLSKSKIMFKKVKTCAWLKHENMP